MSFEFKRVDPQMVREEVVNFFWQQRHWPGDTIDDYYRMWDWRYRALSDGPPLVYIARVKDTRELVGHIGIYRRTFRCGNVDLKFCVPGNLLVHPDWQKNIIGARLAMFVRTLVESREFDAVLAFGNPNANAMFLRLGFTELGAMHTYVDVREAGPLLRRRAGALAVVAPLINASFAVHRRWSRRGTTRRAPARLRRLTADEFLPLDRSHWAPPSRLVSWDSNQYVVDRYLREPDAERHLHGLFNSNSSLLEGFVVTEPTSRLKVWDCQTNSATISPPDAINAVVEHREDAETVLVPTLPQSDLAQDFVRAGFFDRRSVDSTETTTFLSAYSSRNNTHADILGNQSRWNIWLGSRHY